MGSGRGASAMAVLVPAVLMLSRRRADGVRVHLPELKRHRRRFFRNRSDRKAR